MQLKGTRARRCCWALSLVILSAVQVTPAHADDVVVDARRQAVTTGRHTAFAVFQRELYGLLSRCGKGETARGLEAELSIGKIGPATRGAVAEALQCEPLEGEAATPLEREGVITARIWRAVTRSDNLPSPLDKANAMVLSFEGTDFGAPPEWNFCQDGIAASHSGAMQCYNTSDPCSYLTWGPRGATAGSGREIQLILRQVEREEPELLLRLFGSEYPQLERLYGLKAGRETACAGPVPLKVFLCAVWMTPERKAIWESALAQLGEAPRVRQIYDRLYAATEYDGAKFKDFTSLWSTLGLYVSEIDFAFFLDRITHLGGPPDKDDQTVAAMRRCMGTQRGAVSQHGAARRCLSRIQPHRTQLRYRLGRDVAYYLDAYEKGALEEREIEAWSRYVPISAGHTLGLRDDRPYAVAQSRLLSALGIEAVAERREDVTPDERKVCPATVLAPFKSRKP